MLNFSDQLIGKEKYDSDQQHDLRAIARNPSLSTINEERSSQISVYESAEVSLVEDKAEVSVSIDGRDVSLSLYETPDLSEHDAKQIADLYAEEISDHLSSEHIQLQLCNCKYSYLINLKYINFKLHTFLKGI